MIWNQKSSTVNKVVAATKQYLTQWTISHSRSSIALLQLQVDGDRAFICVKSQLNIIKVSVDAVIFEDRKVVGFDLIAKD